METSKTGARKGSDAVATALPGRALATSKSPRMLKPFEIDLLRQDLKAVLAYLRGRSGAAAHSNAVLASMAGFHADDERRRCQCQIRCQIGGFEGREGDQNLCTSRLGRGAPSYMKTI